MAALTATSRIDALLGRTLGTKRAEPAFVLDECCYDPRSLLGARPFSEMRHVPRSLRIPVVVALALAVVVPLGFAVGVAAEGFVPLRGVVRGFFFAAMAAFVVVSVTDILEHVRLERELTGRFVAAKVVPLGESLLHAAIGATLAALFVLSRPLEGGTTLRDFFVVAAPVLFLALGWTDELVYHRRRAQQREHILHTLGHLAAAAMLVSFVTLRFVDWSALAH